MPHVPDPTKGQIVPGSPDADTYTYRKYTPAERKALRGFQNKIKEMASKARTTGEVGPHGTPRAGVVRHYVEVPGGKLRPKTPKGIKKETSDRKKETQPRKALQPAKTAQGVKAQDPAKAEHPAKVNIDASVTQQKQQETRQEQKTRGPGKPGGKKPKRPKRPKKTAPPPTEEAQEETPRRPPPERPRRGAPSRPKKEGDRHREKAKASAKRAMEAAAKAGSKRPTEDRYQTLEGTRKKFSQAVRKSLSTMDEYGELYKSKSYLGPVMRQVLHKKISLKEALDSVPWHMQAELLERLHKHG